MVVGSRWVASSILETAGLLGFFTHTHTPQSLEIAPNGAKNKKGVRAETPR